MAIPWLFHTRAGRTINCRCVYPAVTNRLHGGIRDAEVLTSAKGRQIYSRNMLYHDDQVREGEAEKLK